MADDLAVAKLEWRVDALDEWRDHVDDELHGLRRDVDEMTNAQAIAKAVEKGMARRNRVQLTWMQRTAGAVIFLLTVADFIRSWK